QLTAGTQYTFTMTAGTMLDPYLWLLNSSGTAIVTNDDASGLNSAITYTPTASGTYYIAADSYYHQAGIPGDDPGTYTLTMTDGGTPPPPPPGGGGPLDSITWGYTAPSVINVYFVPGGVSFDDPYDSPQGTSSWSTYEQQQAMLAFETFENVANVTFNVVTDPNQADFFMVESTDPDSSLGYWGVGGVDVSIDGTNYTQLDGHGVFYNGGQGWTTSGLQQGGYGFITLIHEIGHGMGLAHPHDTGGTSSVMSGVTSAFGDLGDFNLNQGIFTTMSYNDGWQTAPHGASPSNNYGWQGTPMAFDIAVLQALYGANMSTNTGNNTYTLFTANQPAGQNAFYSAIWDADGIDTIVNPGDQAAIIDLREAPLTYAANGGGYVSHVSGIHGGFTIAAGVVIENATGGGGTDTIIGNAVSNVLEGGGGNDSLNGGAGADILNGESIDAGFDPVAGQVFRLYQATLDRNPDTAGHQGWTAQLMNGTVSLQQAAANFVNSPEFQNTYGATTNTQFVTLLYNNVLNRNPDPAGLNSWVSQLDSGALTRAQVVLGFSESAEFVGNSAAGALNFSRAGYQADWSDDVFRIYQATLGRNPDAGGFENWTENLANGGTYLDAITGFVNSVEFQNTYGSTTNSDFVTLLYQNVLGRAPNPAELAGWSNQLDSGALTRAEVVRGFAQSAEFQLASAPALEAWMRAQGGDRLAGGSGDNILFGGIGADTFVFDTADSGTQTIADMEAWDTVEIAGSSFANVNALIASLTQDGGDVVLNDNGTTIRFEDTTISDFDTDMFVFV
ncbi:MAG TPA: hypothetical protein DIW51_09170, partial [Rhodospirillaceae bacterium]|nr:hypothetical protein [Rhodospirillaceae bacterium]